MAENGKYNKIKKLIDDLGDNERQKDKDQPLISASTALNTVTEIWKIIYNK